MTDQKAWIYDPRDGSIALLDDGGAKLATVWTGVGSKLLMGYLDADWVFDEGKGPSRPALWERRKVDGEKVWNLTVLPVPEGYSGFSLVRGNAKGQLVGIATAADGTVHSMYVTR